MLTATGVATSLKSNGKISASHSRNSSLVEDHDGYVPMIPGVHHRYCFLFFLKVIFN